MSETFGELLDIVVGNFGQTIVLTAKDRDSVALDISAYSGTKTLFARSPNGRKTVDAECSFTTNGTDGKVQFTFAEGDIDMPGDWIGTVELLKSGGQLSSLPFSMPVSIRVGT